MTKKTVILILVIIAVSAIAGGVWYYLNRSYNEPIEKIMGKPGAYEGKIVAIEGEVSDRTSFFVIQKFFKVRDKTGEITVATRTNLPGVKSRVRVKGTIDESFPIGDQKLLVFIAESVEEEK